MSNKIYLLKLNNVKNSIEKSLDKEKDGEMCYQFHKVLDFEDRENMTAGKENDGTEFILLNISEDKVFKIEKISSKYYDTTLKNVTEDIITGVLDEYKIIYKTPYHKEFLSNFRLSNITIDDVLDKINKYGIDSLDDFDKSILNK
jgi:2-iminoacetate synthase ThiH